VPEGDNIAGWFLLFLTNIFRQRPNTDYGMARRGIGEILENQRRKKSALNQTFCDSLPRYHQFRILFLRFPPGLRLPGALAWVLRKNQ
jgi:hypothetical protein